MLEKNNSAFCVPKFGHGDYVGKVYALIYVCGDDIQ